MNVLLVAEYYFANPPFIHLSRELAKRKHNVSIVTSFRTVDRGANTEAVRIFEIKPFVTIYKIPRTISFPLLRLRQIVKKQNIDVVHAPNDGSTNVATAVMVAKSTYKPFIYTIQGPGTRTGHPLVDTLANLYDYTVDRWLAREAQKVILLSKSLISRAEKLRIERSKIVVIPSGVDSRHFNPERYEVKKKASQINNEFNLDDEIVIGYVGRLYPAKGLTYLFHAVKKIQERYRNIVLLIVGDGSLRNELEVMARDLNVRSIFAGWQRDTAPYYSIMDIFVLPSLFEGVPNVILEAMAMKIPVIATKVGGNPDILSNGKNGFLVPVRNVQQLALALEKLIGDDNLRAQMGAIERQKVEAQFLWSKTAENVEKVYTDCIESQNQTYENHDCNNMLH